MGAFSITQSWRAGGLGLGQICLRNDMVLLVRRRGTKWRFSSGPLGTGEEPIVAAARELWKELSLHCPGLKAVGTIKVGNVLHYIFTTDLLESCSAVLGRDIIACKWVGWDELGSTMLKPTAAALLSRDLTALVHHGEMSVSRVSSIGF
ncbi:NUDIX domain-containing protein [Pseudomonas putida]|uniref:NUDIX domain-containing protein n=1 Tax=Pseudomonas putida TaxID=303 RepID=UPI0021564E8C|nr:NUDIX domain-containing protein [Pseudomonas putida]